MQPLEPPRADPRDAPGTDDHNRLWHPHGDAVYAPWPYFLDDFPSYVLAGVAAHRFLSERYLGNLRDGAQPPLCATTHTRALTGVEDLPHSLRTGATALLAEIERETGRRAGLLQAWRHLGLDCEAAERRGC